MQGAWRHRFERSAPLALTTPGSLGLQAQALKKRRLIRVRIQNGQVSF
jgi:hypothetical protein